MPSYFNLFSFVWAAGQKSAVSKVLKIKLKRQSCNGRVNKKTKRRWMWNKKLRQEHTLTTCSRAVAFWSPLTSCLPFVEVLRCTKRKLILNVFERQNTSEGKKFHAIIICSLWLLFLKIQNASLYALFRLTKNDLYSKESSELTIIHRSAVSRFRTANRGK